MRFSALIDHVGMCHHADLYFVQTQCQFGSLDFGMAGDGRWQISWYFVDSPPASVATQNVGAVARAAVPKTKSRPKPHPKPAKKVHHHTPTYYVKLRAAQLRSYRKKHPKGRKMLLLADAGLSAEQLQLPAAES